MKISRWSGWSPGMKKFFAEALLWNHYDIKYACNIDKDATHFHSCIWLYCLRPSRKLQWLWNPTNACNAWEVKKQSKSFPLQNTPKGIAGTICRDKSRRWCWLELSCKSYHWYNDVTTLHLQIKKRGWWMLVSQLAAAALTPLGCVWSLTRGMQRWGPFPLHPWSGPLKL